MFNKSTIACVLLLALATCTLSQALKRDAKKLENGIQLCIQEVSTFNFQPDCVSLLLSKTLSLGIMFGSFSLKVPQLITMIKGSTAKGVSFSSLYFEIMCMILTIGYSFHFGFAITTYAETIIITFQNLIILTLSMVYKEVNFFKFFIGFSTSVGFLALFVLDVLPDQVYVYNQLIVLVLTVLSKVPQILKIIKDQSSGVLSVITFFLSSAGCYARVFTTLVEVPDKFILVV